MDGATDEQAPALDASAALAKELDSELLPEDDGAKVTEAKPSKVPEIEPAEETGKRQEAGKRSWTGWLRGSKPAARPGEDGMQSEEKGASGDKAVDQEKPAAAGGESKPAEASETSAGAPASSLGKWSTWVAQAATTASTAAGRAVANAKTAAGGARNVAGIVYRTGTVVAQDLRKTLATANYNDYNLAVERLEQHAKKMSGEDRLVSLKRWIAVLRELKGSKAGLPKRGSEEEEEEDDVARGLVANAHSVLFFDEEISPEPMNFRGLFLRSSGLEAIVDNFVQVGPVEKEQKLLVELFDLVFGGTSHQHKAVVAALADFAQALEQQPTEQVVPKAKITGLVIGAISKLKAKAELEALDAKLQKLEAEVGEKLTDEKESRTDDAAAVAALEVVQASSRGLGMLQRRLDLVKALQRNEEELEEAVEALEATKAEIRKGKEDVDSQLVDSKLKKLEGDTFRESRLKEVEKELGVVGKEVEGLQKRKDDLEAELSRVNAALAKAHGRETTLKEERQAFEESSTEVLDHLRKAMTKMEALAVGYTFEGALVVKGLALMDSMFMVDETTRAGVEKSQEEALTGLERGLSRSALWHANCTLEAITRVVMTLKDYALELDEVIRNEAAAKLQGEEATGDEAALQELLGRRHQLEDLYAQSELEGLDVLHQHAVMTSERDFVSGVCGGFQTDEAKVADSALEELISRIAERSAEFHGLSRPVAPPSLPGAPVTDEGQEEEEEEEESKAEEAPAALVSSAEGEGAAEEGKAGEEREEPVEAPSAAVGKKEQQQKGEAEGQQGEMAEEPAEEPSPAAAEEQQPPAPAAQPKDVPVATSAPEEEAGSVATGEAQESSSVPDEADAAEATSEAEDSGVAPTKSSASSASPTKQKKKKGGKKR